MSMADEYYSKYLPGLIKSGKVTMAELDDATRHVLNVKYDMGLFNDPIAIWGRKRATRRTPMPKAACIVKRRGSGAGKCGTAEKPAGNAAAEKSGTIAVVGPLADSQRDVMGSWSAAGVANQSVTVLAGIQNAVGDGRRSSMPKGRISLTIKISSIS